MKRVHLWSLGPSSLSLDTVRDAAIAIDAYLCNGLAGRVMGDIVFEYVTERRQTLNAKARLANPNTREYSACGDKEHCSLFMLGVRDETLVNRDSDGGNTPWVSGVNISRLYNHRAFRRPASKDGTFLEAIKGDVLCMYRGTPGSEHVCKLIAFDLQMARIWTYDYGQKLNGIPSGQMRIRKLEFNQGKWMLDGFELLGWLDLTSLPIVESAIVPDEFTGGTPSDEPLPPGFDQFPPTGRLVNPG